MPDDERPPFPSVAALVVAWLLICIADFALWVTA